MANKVIQLTADTIKKTGLEVYRDISMEADLNQANILKSFKEVIPMAYIADDVNTSFYKKINGKTTKVSYLSNMFDESMFNESSMLTAGTICKISRCVGQSASQLTGTVENVQLTVDTQFEVNKNFMLSDLNQTTWNSNINYPLTGDELLQGEVSAVDFVKTGFFINAQVSDTYYEEEYGTDINDWLTCLKYSFHEKKGPIVTEDKLNEILLLSDSGQVSSLTEWREAKKWNPYKLAKLVNVKSVFNSIRNIFTWTPGERLLNPEFGSNLKKLLYNGITEFTVESILAEIRRCISQYEPRVQIQSIQNASTVSDTEQNTIQIDIVFTIPSLSKEQFVYSYKYKQYDNE